MSKKWAITNCAMNAGTPVNHYSLSGTSIGVPSAPTMEMDITVTFFEPPDMTGIDDMEAIEKMLQTSNVPDWCTNKMLHEALKEKYPERYL